MNMTEYIVEMKPNDKGIPVPTAKQELVRCNDCKHNSPFGCKKHNVIVSDDFFCADGERKNDV